MNKYISLLSLGLMLMILNIQYVSAIWMLVPVPNGSFESGIVGLVPDNWVMNTYNGTDPWDGPKTATFIHEMKQTDQKYFDGSKSLWIHSRIVDEGLRQGRGSETIAETEDWINAPSATHVRIYIRDIKSTHSLFWGWDNSITLQINNVSVAETWAVSQYWPYIFTHGETLNWNLYNYTTAGADGQDWYVYEYSIPASVDKTHMKIQIICWAWDWTFYDISYYSDLEFVVDNVELLGLPLSASISPLSASIILGQSVTFTSTVSGGAAPLDYQWYLDDNPVSGATSNTWIFTSINTGTYTIYLNVTDNLGSTTKSNEALVTVATHLTASISPMSASVLVGQSVAFTSTVSGGYSPYSYQWYLNDHPVSGATSPSWAFAPVTSGIHHVYLKVTDSKGNTAQSETAQITVAILPAVGGYAVPIKAYTPTMPSTPYIALIAILTIGLTTIRRKVARKTK